MSTKMIRRLAIVWLIAFLALTGVAQAQLVLPGAGSASSTGAFFNASAGNKSTSSNSTVMAGFGGTCTVTPKTTGRVLFIFDYQIQQTGGNITLNQGIYYGTGTAPTNGASATGTAAGPTLSYVPSSVNYMPFIALGAVSGLTLNTAYWFDLQETGSSSVTSALQNGQCTAIEF